MSNNINTRTNKNKNTEIIYATVKDPFQPHSSHARFPRFPHARFPRMQCMSSPIQPYPLLSACTMHVLTAHMRIMPCYSHAKPTSPHSQNTRDLACGYLLNVVA